MMRGLVLAVLLALLFSEAGSAATVQVVGDDDAVRYIAGLGESNDLTFTELEDAWPSAYLISDPGATITAGRRCVSIDAHRAACVARSGSMYHLRAQLLDGDDVLHPAGFQLVRANGGPGNDRLLGGTWDDELDGGGGTDELRGGGGSDVLHDGDGDGPSADADILDGGDDGDTVSYKDRSEPVTVDLSDPAPDGAAGEGDVIVGVESVHGGRGDDRLIGDDGPNGLVDEGGNNRISGRGGPDTIQAPSGRIDCGASVDEVRGVRLRPLLMPTCETVRRGFGDDDFIVRAYPRAAAGGLTLPMQCSTFDGEPFECSGTVTITARKRTLARGRLAPGTERRIARLLITPEGRALLARRRVVARIALRGSGLPDLSWRVTLGRPG